MKNRTKLYALRLTGYIALGLLVWLAMCTPEAKAQDSPSYTFISIGAGSHSIFKNRWDDGDGIGASLNVGYSARISDDLRLNSIYRHHSQYDVGVPFNNYDESISDSILIELEWRFNLF